MQIVTVSIPPRLDEFDVRVHLYNEIMADESKKNGCIFLSVEDDFPATDKWLWSFRDSIHLSADYGLPLLIECILDELSLYEEEQIKDTQPEQIWRQSRHRILPGKATLRSLFMLFGTLLPQTNRASHCI